MTHHAAYRIGPTKTPKPIKILVLITSILSVLISLFAPLAHKFNLFYFLGLSLDGVKSGFFWQVLTYLIVFPSPGITAGFILHLAFNMYLLWILGTSILERRSTKEFFLLLVVSGVISALASLTVMSFGFSSYILAGSSIVVYTLLIGWMMLNKDAVLHLFFTIPIPVKWLVLGFLGISLLGDLSRGDFVSFISYLSAVVTSYFFSLFVWQTRSPIISLANFEKKIILFFHQKKMEKENKKHQSFHEAKVYDFKTGEPLLDDDEFMDAMLSRISLYGKDILTKKERKRMEKISKKKEQNK